MMSSFDMKSLWPESMRIYLLLLCCFYSRHHYLMFHRHADHPRVIKFYSKMVETRFHGRDKMIDDEE